MTNALIADALRVAREHMPQSGEWDTAELWRIAAIYLAGQLEIALRDTSAGFSRLPPQRPTRALKVDRKDTLAVSKW